MPLAVSFATPAAASTALLNFWHPLQGKRSNLMRRHAQSKIVALMEHGLSLSWALAAVFAVLGSAAILLPLGLVAGLLWFNRPGRPQSRKSAVSHA